MNGIEIRATDFE